MQNRKPQVNNQPSDPYALEQLGSKPKRRVSLRFYYQHKPIGALHRHYTKLSFRQPGELQRLKGGLWYNPTTQQCYFHCGKLKIILGYSFDQILTQRSHTHWETLGGSVGGSLIKFLTTNSPMLDMVTLARQTNWSQKSGLRRSHSKLPSNSLPL